MGSKGQPNAFAKNRSASVRTANIGKVTLSSPPAFKEMNAKNFKKKSKRFSGATTHFENKVRDIWDPYAVRQMLKQSRHQQPELSRKAQATDPPADNVHKEPSFLLHPTQGFDFDEAVLLSSVPFGLVNVSRSLPDTLSERLPTRGFFGVDDSAKPASNAAKESIAAESGLSHEFRPCAQNLQASAGDGRL